MRQAVVDLASQPIRNLSIDPRATRYQAAAAFTVVGSASGLYWMNNRWGTYSTYSLVTNATDGPPSINSYARLTVKAATAIGGRNNLGFHISENPEATAPDGRLLVAVTPGQTITLSIFVRSSIAVSIDLRIRFATVTPGVIPAVWTSGIPGVNIDNVVSVAAGVWTRIFRTVTVPPGGNGLAAYVVNGQPMFFDGDTLDSTGLMQIEGPDPGYHVDGSFPGWRWLGTAGASSSVGYPYTLESIAGTPLAVNLAPNTAVAYTAPPAMAGRTLYVVHDTTVPATATLLPYAGAGNTVNASNTGANEILIYRHSASARVETRVQTGNNAAIFVSGATSAESVGRHVGISYVREGDLGYGLMYDSASDMFTAQPIPAGFPTGTQWLTLAGPHAAGASVGAWLFGSEHSLETRRRVMAWLARKYGAPIPIGY